jgi:hypothetical protein
MKYCALNPLQHLTVGTARWLKEVPNMVWSGSCIQLSCAVLFCLLTDTVTKFTSSWWETRIRKWLNMFISLPVCFILHLSGSGTGSGAHPASCLMSTRVLSPEVNSQGMRLTTHLRLVPESRMIVIHTFIVWHLTDTTYTWIVMRLKNGVFWDVNAVWLL